MPGKNIFTIAFILSILFFASCANSTRNCGCSDLLPEKLDTLNITSSNKGWELYTWPGDRQGCTDWNYSILPGTNRLKSYNEVTSDTVLLKVTGEKQLKSLLRKFPENETILWFGEDWLYTAWGQSKLNGGSLKLPPFSIINEINLHRLNLIISQ